MKKILYGLIILSIQSHLIFSMEEKTNEDRGHVFSKLDPKLQSYVIKQGIQSILNSNSDPIEAIIDASKYLKNATSANNFLLSKKAELENELKFWAKKKFAPEYEGLSEQELNQKLNETMYGLESSGKNIPSGRNVPITFDYYNYIRNKISLNESPERDEIIKLIIAGADPNFIGTKSIIPGLKTFQQGLLQLMAGLEDVNAVRLLIAYGANVNRLVGGQYPLGAAIRGNYGHLDIEKAKKIIQLLIMAHANLNERDQGANLAVRIAATENRSILELILEHGAKLNETDINWIKTRIHKPDDILDILKKYGYRV